MPQATDDQNIAYGYPVSANNIVHGYPLPPWEHNLRQPPPSAPHLITTTTTTTPVTNRVNITLDDVTQERSEINWPVVLPFGIVFAVFVAYLLFGLAGAFYVSDDPKFEIDSFKVSSFNLSDSRLTANWDIKISTETKNKRRGITYTSFKVSVSHHAANLSSEEFVAGFHQPPKHKTFVNARLSAYMLNISDWNANIMAIEKGLDHEGIDFDVRIKTKFHYTFGWIFRTFTDSISALCKGVKVGFSPNATEGTMLGTMYTCR